jgi:O-methyltransferase
MLGRLLAPFVWQRPRSVHRDASDRDTLARALKFEHYWYNAQKKIDQRRLPTFGPLAERVRAEGRTYLHVDRLYTLWQAVVSMPASARAVIEIGVYEGGSVRFVAEAMRARGLDLPIAACDTFAGHAVVDETVDGRHTVGKQFVRANIDAVRDYLRGHANVQVVAGDIHETSASLHSMQALGLVHIDVDVYPPTRHCLEVFGPRVVQGGTIVVDDYGFKTCPGAKKAVDEFAAAHPEFRLWHLTTGQAILVRLAGQAGSFV